MFFLSQLDVAALHQHGHAATCMELSDSQPLLVVVTSYLLQQERSRSR
jgi:hypothetical protein